MKSRFCLALLIGALLAPFGAYGDLGVIILERIGFDGRIYGTGHSAIYLSHVCTAGSPVKLRMCGPGEEGVVIQRYADISTEEYDWFATPFSHYFYGVDAADEIPLFANKKIESLLLTQAYRALNLGGALKSMPGEEVPNGKWQNSFNNAFRRTSFMFILEATIEDERKVVETFNAAPNKEKFNAFWANCSDLPRNVMKMVFSEAGRGAAGLGMTTPKGLAKESIKLARKNNPEGLLVVERIPELPGTYSRSGGNLYPLENAFRNPYYAIPVAVLAPQLFVGSFIYHTLLNPFSIPREYQKYASADLSRLALREKAFAKERGELNSKIYSLKGRGEGRELSEAQARLAVVATELEATKKLRQQERMRIFGSDALWNEYKTGFASIVDRVSKLIVPAEVRRILDNRRGLGDLSDALFGLFEKQGTYSIDSGGNAVMKLSLTDDRIRQVGITRGNFTSGDDLVSLLVMMGRVDHYLSVNWRQRDTLEAFQQDWMLLRQAACRLQVCE